MVVIGIPQRVHIGLHVLADLWQLLLDIVQLQLEVLGELPSCKVIVKAKMMTGISCLLDDTTILHDCRIATC